MLPAVCVFGYSLCPAQSSLQRFFDMVPRPPARSRPRSNRPSEPSGKVNNRFWGSGLANTFAFKYESPEDEFRVNHNYYYARDSEFTRTALEDRGAFDASNELQTNIFERYRMFCCCRFRDKGWASNCNNIIAAIL